MTNSDLFLSHVTFSLIELFVIEISKKDTLSISIIITMGFLQSLIQIHDLIDGNGGRSTNWYHWGQVCNSLNNFRPGDSVDETCLCAISR